MGISARRWPVHGSVRTLLSAERSCAMDCLQGLRRAARPSCPVPMSGTLAATIGVSRTNVSMRGRNSTHTEGSRRPVEFDRARGVARLTSGAVARGRTAPKSWGGRRGLSGGEEQRHALLRAQGRLGAPVAAELTAVDGVEGLESARSRGTIGAVVEGVSGAGRCEVEWSTHVPCQ